MHESLDDEQHEVDEMEPWLLSYADLFTLLVCFFVVLVSTSVFDEQRYSKLAESLGGIVEGKPGLDDVKVVPKDAVIVLDQTELRRGLEEAVDRAGLAGQVSVRMTSRGVELAASSELLFLSGQAEVGDKGVQLMATVARITAPLPCVIAVEGHTDDVPISSRQFPSNWELSTARASSVVRRLVEAGIAPARLTAVGYADARPAARPVEGTPVEETRSRNRRVVLIITHDENSPAN